jgi:phosphoribosylaminoimidazole (AIR) synthetase
MAVDRVKLRVSDPTGILETSVLHADRLDTLEGKTICELSNGAWQFDRIFPYVREQLKKQYPTVRVLPYDEGVGLRAELENLDHVIKVLKEKGCQAVIAGMAA